jgi:hypothetical protein
MTEAGIKALQNLRQINSFDWTFVPMLAFVFYAYSLEVRKKEWGRLALSIGFFAGELMWEMFNALILHFTQFSALWTVSGKSIFLIFVGINIEIAFMFSLAPIVLFNLLPEDRGKKIGGLPNRVLIPGLLGIVCVFVESLLNHWGALVWSYKWWSWPNVWLIIIAYVTPFIILARLHDIMSQKAKIKAAIICVAACIASYVILVSLLGWI